MIQPQRFDNCPYAVAFIDDQAFSQVSLSDEQRKREVQAYACRHGDIVKRGNYPIELNTMIPDLGDVPLQKVAVFYNNANSKPKNGKNEDEPRACIVDFTQTFKNN